MRKHFKMPFLEFIFFIEWPRYISGEERAIDFNDGVSVIHNEKAGINSKSNIFDLVSAYMVTFEGTIQRPPANKFNLNTLAVIS